jgi:hypothetical protein
MATLLELTDGVYRDLADEAEPHVFSVLQVEDFIRGGIAELNRVAPSDTVYDIPLVADPDTGVVTQFSYDVPIELPYNVEVVRNSDGARWSMADPGDGGVMNPQGGYTFRRTATGGTIDFPAWWLRDFDPALLAIRLTGYAVRPLPYTIEGDPSPTVPLSAEEAFSVRAFAKAEGYDLLAHDRSLFAQWQGQTNNTDVSPTQLMQMAGNAKSDWDRQRGLARVVRRYW